MKVLKRIRRLTGARGAPNNWHDGQPSPFQEQLRLLAGADKSRLHILDVGAHKGQSARKYREVFPAATIHCFEPYDEPLIELSQLAESDPLLKVVPKAVAGEAGESEFYLNAFSPTNSLLPRPNSGRRYYPEKAGASGHTTVKTIILDDYAEDQRITKPCILKLDIQGGELEALKGAGKLLASGAVLLIYSEVMFVAHYEAAPLFHDICSFLNAHGYTLFNIYDIHHARNGQIRYADGLFICDEVREQVVDADAPEP